METWESIWQGLLWEACSLVASVSQKGDLELRRCAAAIVLACTSWETFVNELIQWRRLDSSKRANFLPKLKGVLTELGALESGASPGPEWDGLRSVMKLRNLIVHHKADPVAGGMIPQELSGLVREPISAASEADLTTWERLLLTTRTASDCCYIIAESILRLEALPIRRKRSLAEMESTIRRALEPLGHSRSGYPSASHARR